MDRTPTLPGALDLPYVEIGVAEVDQSTPDSVNSNVAVVGRSVCPPHTKCQIPDGIRVRSLAQRSDYTIFIPVEKPQQFYIDRAYTLSLWRTGPYDVAGTERYNLHILGFDPYGP